MQSVIVCSFAASQAFRFEYTCWWGAGVACSSGRAFDAAKVQNDNVLKADTGMENERNLLQ